MTNKPTTPPINSPLIDIGANLTHASFSDDLDEVMFRSRESNVNHLVVTGTNIEESERAIQLALQYPNQLYTTAGIHPHDAKLFSESSVNALRKLAEHTVVKAIGECGLDFNRMFSSREQQIHAFEKQIELAIELDIPLFMHERDAHDTQWEILKHYRDDINDGVIHCFTGDKQAATRYLDLDLYLGITGWICDERRGSHLHALIKDIPADRLMIESDAPYLLPRVKPKLKLKSSRRNEPCTLPHVLNEIAKHSPLSLEEIAKNTTENARRFFRIDDN